MLRHICPSLTLDTAKTIASIVGSRLDYCNSVLYRVLQANIDRLHRNQNVLARVVAQAPSTISSIHIWRDLHWLPINHRISYKLLTWKALHTAEPSYLSELISPYVPARTLRSSNTVFLQYPLASQVTSPHVLFLLLHRQPGTPYLYIFTLYRISLPLSVN